MGDALGTTFVFVLQYGIYGQIGVDAGTATKIFGIYVDVDKSSSAPFVMYVEGGRFFIKNNFEAPYTVTLTHIK